MAWKQILVLLCVFAIAFEALAGCGAAQSGVGAAQTPSAAAPSAAAGGSQAGPVADQASLISALQAVGANVATGWPVEQPFLQVPGQVLTVGGQELQVYEYADAAAAQADVAALADVLAGKGTTMVTWVAPPHAYRAGRVIALYVGDDAATLTLLQGVLGAPVAERRP